MDKKIMDSDIGPTNLKQLALAGVVKYGAERALMPVVGDGNFISAGTKIAGALTVDAVAGDNLIGSSVALGVGIDGIEDLFYSVKNLMDGSKTAGLIRNVSDGAETIM